MIDQQSITFTLGTNSIVFTTPPSLVAGQTYVWRVLLPTAVPTIYANFATNNPYPQGDVLGAPGFGYDLDFQIFI